MIELYTDGSYSSKRDQGGIGVVVVKDGKLVQKLSAPYKGVTNNKMELLAVITAINSIKKPIDDVTVFTDSMYVIGCATKNWKKKKNLKLWALYDRVFEKVNALVTNGIKFEHVKGHTDNKWNNLCDKIAVEASQLEL